MSVNVPSLVTYTSWYVEAPVFGPFADETKDLNQWHRTEAEARKTFIREVARVGTEFPNLRHLVRLVRVERTIIEEGSR